MNCAQWLSVYLADGPTVWDITRASARIEGFTKGELTKARRELGVISKRANISGKNVIVWSLPNKQG